MVLLELVYINLYVYIERDCIIVELLLHCLMLHVCCVSALYAVYVQLYFKDLQLVLGVYSVWHCAFSATHFQSNLEEQSYSS